MRVRRAPAVRASFGHHPAPPREARLSKRSPSLDLGLTLARLFTLQTRIFRRRRSNLFLRHRVRQMKKEEMKEDQINEVEI
jgi:hypothetical protein